MRLNLFNNPVNARGQILGCSNCPLDKVSGVRKIKGLVRIKQRKAFLWAQSPGGTENERGLELVGPSGKLVWDTFSLFDLPRSIFDVQNVLRCQPVSSDGNEHAPSKQELQCCSVFNEEAIELNQGSAQVHIIFGEVAGQQLLGTAFKRDKPVFWYPTWDCYVVLVQHPSFILRQGGSKAGYDYDIWKTKLGAVKTILSNPGHYGYLKSQNYIRVDSVAKFDEMERVLRAESKKRRISFDIEDDVVDGKRIILLAGFGIGHFADSKNQASWTGRAWSVVLEHPDSGLDPKLVQTLKNRVKVLVEDESIKKSLQNGSYDENTCRETLGARLRGYEYDTQYGTYLRYSFLRSCRLEDLSYLFFPEFADYKDIVTPWEKTGFSKAPLDKLILRNCGDCDLTKRLEEKFSPHVRQPLVRVYINAGKTLDKMESRGPILDWDSWKKAEAIIPKMMAKLDRMLQRVSGDPNFNCDNPPEVARLLYDVLQLPVDEESGRSTAKPVLEKLLAETGNKTIELVQTRRKLGKMKGTYLNGYANSARAHNDELHTRWALTGAVTGRLRSSGTDDNGVNLQNLHGFKLIQNMLISDKNWRNAVANKSIEEILDLEVFLAADGSQIEIRALAELSKDPVMIRLLQEAAKNRKDKTKDFHSQNGHMLTGWPVERIATDKGIRRSVKNLIFGIVFGKSEDGMYDYIVAKIREAEGLKADLTGITRKRTKMLYRKFFSVYKGVRIFINKMRLQAEKQGFVETLFGFVRHIRQNDPERSTNPGNQAINSPVQGTAHQFVLIALALLELKPKTYCYLQKPIMEVHDALFFRVKLRYLLEAYKQLMHLFEVGAIEYAEREFTLKLQVPLLAEAEAGFCMGSMIPFEGEELEVFLTNWRKKQAEIEAKSWEDLMPVMS